MKKLLILKIWQHKLPALSALATILTVFFWPSVPLLGVTNWLKFFYSYTPQNYLYAGLAVLAGLYVGIYVYNKKVAPTCSTKSAGVGATGSFAGILLGACPACIPVIAFFLPLSVTIYLSYISWVFLVLALALMLFSIYKMNGFAKF